MSLSLCAIPLLLNAYSTVNALSCHILYSKIAKLSDEMRCARVPQVAAPEPERTAGGAPAARSRAPRLVPRAAVALFSRPVHSLRPVRLSAPLLSAPRRFALARHCLHVHVNPVPFQYSNSYSELFALHCFAALDSVRGVHVRNCVRGQWALFALYSIIHCSIRFHSVDVDVLYESSACACAARTVRSAESNVRSTTSRFGTTATATTSTADRRSTRSSTCSRTTCLYRCVRTHSPSACRSIPQTTMSLRPLWPEARTRTCRPPVCIQCPRPRARPRVCT